VAKAALVIAQAVELGLARVAVEVASQVAAELVIGPAAEPELGTVLAAEPELGTVPVAAELEHVPVEALELVIGPAEAELEHVQGEAELELVRAAVALRTKSVTAAHRRDLVLRLAAEDLAAAAAETTREPVAGEAVIAWEVAE